MSKGRGIARMFCALRGQCTWKSVSGQSNSRIFAAKRRKNAQNLGFRGHKGLFRSIGFCGSLCVFAAERRTAWSGAGARVGGHGRDAHATAAENCELSTVNLSATLAR